MITPRIINRGLPNGPYRLSFCSGISLDTPCSLSPIPSFFSSSGINSPSQFSCVSIPTALIMFSASTYLLSVCPTSLPITLVYLISNLFGAIPPSTLFLSVTKMLEAGKPQCCRPMVFLFWDIISYSLFFTPIPSFFYSSGINSPSQFSCVSIPTALIMFSASTYLLSLSYLLASYFGVFDL